MREVPKLFEHLRAKLGDEVELLRFTGRLQTDRDFARAAERLHQRILEAALCERFANLVDLDRLVVRRFDENAAGEVERVVEPARPDQPDREDHQHDRDRHADLAPAEKIDLAVGWKEFHG